MFWIAAAIISGTVLSTAMRRSAREGLWLAWWSGLLICPAWLTFHFGSLEVDLRTVALGSALVGFALQPEAGPHGLGRPVVADFLALLLTAGNLGSEFMVGKFGPLTGPEIVRLWLLPYVVGRLFLRTADDIPAMLGTFSPVCAFASIYAMVESVIKFNPINKLLGKTYGLLEQGEGYRMGLKRAQGATNHPIFFGLVLVMILPWAFEASRLARAGRGPKWWRTVPWLLGGALFGTVSRGPQGSGLLVTFLAIFFRNARLRPQLAICAAVLGLAAFGGKEAILALSAKVSNESAEDVRIITISGEEEEYTGTKHRILLFKVYREYLERAGLWGYGYNMAAVQLEESLALRFGSIDSAYVMLYLQRGYSGIVPFVGLSAITLMTLIVLGWPSRRPNAALCGALFGSTLAVVLALFTSWFAPDFGGVFLFTAGIAAGQSILPAGSTAGEAPAPAPSPITPGTAEVAVRFQLARGYPPPRPVEGKS